jgi:tRNA dimethylallyltransferase
MRPAILIHGPTASGKTQLAIALSRSVDGEIINADAMQCYRDLRVLTARPDADELASAPHHLFGHVDAAIRHSAGDWSREAMSEILRLQERDKTPILVGGTGLYLMSLTEGLSEIPTIPEAVRRQARAIVAGDPSSAWARLEAGDPQSARRIDPADRQRIARALEVLLATGRPLSQFHGRALPQLSSDGWLGIALTPPRETVYKRIDKRVDDMMRAGALEEARQLWMRGLDSDLPVMRAHGMPGFCDFFEARASLADAVERCKRDTRRYAKRQMTWIAHQFTLWTRIPSEDPALRARVITDMWIEAASRRSPATQSGVC